MPPAADGGPCRGAAAQAASKAAPQPRLPRTRRWRKGGRWGGRAGWEREGGGGGGKAGTQKLCAKMGAVGAPRLLAPRPVAPPPPRHQHPTQPTLPLRPSPSLPPPLQREVQDKLAKAQLYMRATKVGRGAAGRGWGTGRCSSGPGAYVCSSSRRAGRRPNGAHTLHPHDHCHLHHHHHPTPTQQQPTDR